MAFYPALIHQGTASFGVIFPDFPGVAGVGDTLEDAIVSGEEGLVAALEVMHEDGTPIPEPCTIAHALEHEDAHDAIATVLIEARFAEPTIRVNTTLPASLVARIDKEAQRRGMSRSGFLAAGARAELARGTR